MGAFTFFPWFVVKEKIIIGDFELHPYLVGRNDFGIGNVVDPYLKSYESFPDRSVERVTLLKVKGKDFLDDLTVDERESIFSFREIFAFSLLEDRQYFSQIGFYTNFDTVQCIVQSFQPGHVGVAVTARTRAGQRMMAYSGKSFKVSSPFHVKAGEVYEIDSTLAKCLMAAYESENFEKYDLAIFNFNRANSDNETTTPYVELVLICSAFERLLEIDPSREDVLVAKFLKVMAIQREHEETNKREVWIRDFYQSRGQFAHGKKRALKKSLWSINEHLLLATFVFHILLKIKLSEGGFYTLADDDQFNIYFFDHLIKSTNLFEPIADDLWKWNDLKNELVWNWILDKKKYL